ncbi:2'-5' RNA ligase [Geothermobacter ehrlichii]|uniref:RNA 2',3'-cyclic phosphodiesterase n=1 Tax=Geothermobacter ehrlichii TaxID=213224 RepID=A0A5D3WKY2_9BACT|nr:RNA 2',3'-cyclic phosphodiesterase [Geothermobacter ehrlichii]TYO97497.1 2'-5' RNA ligase [Geothermobacter ehrlichii]
MSTRTCRLFIAVPTADSLKKRLGELQCRLATGISGLRWTRPESFHVTLCFLGDQTEDSLEKIASAVLSVGRSSQAFSSTCRGLGAFPSSRRARVLWAGLSAGDQWAALHHRLVDGLRDCGIRFRANSFHPHLTLGRARKCPLDLRRLTDDSEPADCGELEVDRIILYESRLQPGGAIHTPRVMARLQPRPA